MTFPRDKRSPGREAYGFAAYVCTTCISCLVLTWSFFPNALRSLGICTPHRYWAVAVPMWFCVTWMLAFVVVNGIIFLQTKPENDKATIADRTLASIHGWERCQRDQQAENRIIQVICDVPLHRVSYALHS
eukprot:m.222497 g.222497  ORF g.222497 m.222497 type:complete len:131 (-) comp15934_c1_seq10:542-934(-)